MLKDNITEILSLVVVIGGGLLYFLMADPNKSGSVLVLVTMVVTFYFGSSTGSKVKDMIMGKVNGKAPEPPIVAIPGPIACPPPGAPEDVGPQTVVAPQ